MSIVLVVEDDLKLLKALNYIISSAGYAAIPTHDPLEALSKVRTESGISIIFTDEVMEQLQGSELLARAFELTKSRTNPVKGVLATGYNVNEELARLRGMGMQVEYLQKPYSSKEVEIQFTDY